MGCSTYGKTFYGRYSDFQSSQDTFQVSYKGNAFCSSNTAYIFFLTRAAEIAKQNGYKYFYILSLENVTTQGSYTTPGKVNTSFDVNRSGNRVYGTVQTDYLPPQEHNYTKPAFSGRILLSNNTETDYGSAYEAQIVFQEGMKKHESQKTLNIIAHILIIGIPVVACITTY